MYGKNSNLKAKKAKQNTHKKKKSQKKQLTDVKKKTSSTYMWCSQERGIGER